MSDFIESGFVELDIPKEAYLGWYVVSLFGVRDRFLHDDYQVHIGTDDGYFSSSGYFPTEYEAHKCAERYYLTHCRKYPYMVLLNGSQIMNFAE